MSISIKRIVGWAAIYLIALQTILLGLTPVVGFRSIFADPLLVICRSNDHAPTSSSGASGNEDHHPGNGCDHCTLCNTSAPPLVPFIALSNLFLVCLALILRPFLLSPTVSCAVGFKLARGPPHIVLT
jgi:hypothetical protein